MTIKVYEENGTTVIAPEGKIDHITVKEFESQRRILNGYIKLHFVVVFKFKTELTVFEETVPAIFIEAIQSDALKAVIVKPLAGRLIGTERTSCNDGYFIPAGYPFIDDRR